jgi:hypothetical protein
MHEQKFAIKTEEQQYAHTTFRHHEEKLHFVHTVYLCVSYNSQNSHGPLRQTLLTFQSLAVSLRTPRFNIKKFYMVLALR